MAVYSRIEVVVVVGKSDITTLLLMLLRQLSLLCRVSPYTSLQPAHGRPSNSKASATSERRDRRHYSIELVRSASERVLRAKEERLASCARGSYTFI